MAADEGAAATTLPSRLTTDGLPPHRGAAAVLIQPSAPEVHLVGLRPSDRTLVGRWLREPGVQRWWGNAGVAEAEIALALDSESAICRLICLGEQPIGYAHALDTANLSERMPVAIPPGSFECDLFIGVEAHRGQGHGQRALELLVEEVFATTLAVACSIVVSIRNERAVRAYERAGFRWVQVQPDPVSGPSWIMLRERPRR